MKRRLTQTIGVLGLASVYVLAARVGLALDAVAGFASVVWPPAGIALAALLIFGYGLWPGILLGAVIANAWAGAPTAIALGIGVGNTLEAVLAIYLLRRVAGFHVSLERLRDVLALIGLAAALSPIVSATIGVASLHLGGIVSSDRLVETWRAWWLGDFMGDLVVAPVLLVWASTKPAWPQPGRLLEIGALVVSVVVVSLLVFGGMAGAGVGTFGQAYLFFPPLIWAALRFDLRGAVTTAFAISAIAVWGTANGRGPFAQPELFQGLFALQMFMGLVAGTILVLGASIAERRRAKEALHRAHQRAAHANRAKSEFLAVMSHELRTPLNAISGYVELLRLELDGPLSEKQQNALSRIQRNQEHLLSLIDDVLSFARIETGRLALTMQKVSVREILDGLEPLIQPELRRKELSFTCDAGDGSLAVQADPEKLRQILLNILANAVKFTPAGGSVTAGAFGADGRVRIWVRDTGIGIPADQLSRVFEPFVQADRGNTRSYPGVGLGLSIARDLARAMGGDVRIESTVGEGSTAWVELDILRADAP